MADYGLSGGYFGGNMPDTGMLNNPGQMFSGFGAPGAPTYGFGGMNSGGGYTDASGGIRDGAAWGNILGGAAGIYGSVTGAQNGQGVINAGNAGFGMARGAYNPTMFGMNGVGGTGFSVSSPTNGGPGSISSSLGAFNPMYGNYAGQAGQYGDMSMNLARTASSGAQGAYQNALGSIMPQLQQMQGNLLAANNNSLFQRGQLGSGSYGQYGSGGNPVNLTTQSLGAGFAMQDLSAIKMAQDQGLNFFNSNLQGAGALGNLGFGATNTGLGMINAQNSLGQMPLQYSGLNTNAQIGSTNALGNVLKATNPGGVDYTGGYGGMATNYGAGATGGIGQLMNGIGQLGGGWGNIGSNISNWLGFNGAGGQAANGLQSVAGIGSSDAAAQAASGFNPMSSGGTGGISGGGSGGFNGAQGMSAVNAGMDIMNDVKNWQSGATGKDALMGAKTGWDIGNTFVPGIGGVIGGAIGGAAGALSSALGGGIRSQESKNWLEYTKMFNQMTPTQQMSAGLSPTMAYQNLQGVMNAHNNSAGHSQPIEQVWGRNNAQGFMDSLGGEINSLARSGKINPNMSVQQQFSQDIAPWLASKNASIANQYTSGGQAEAPALTNDIESLMAAYEGGALNPGSQLGIKGQTIAGLPAFVG